MSEIALRARAEISNQGLSESIRQACAWITDVAMIRTKELAATDNRTFRFTRRYADWRGCFRGEYHAGRRSWDIFCPIWHGGQGVKALALAYELLKTQCYLDDARLSAEFILRHQINDSKHPDDGLILAYESGGGTHVSTSAILESLDGLFVLTRVSGDKRYADAAIRALQWVERRMFLPAEGLFLDEYDPDTRTMTTPAWVRDKKLFTQPGRPLLDDGVFVTGYKLSGDEKLKRVAVGIAERLLKDESPAGNWKAYPPCFPDTGICHPRHAYWWGRPLWMVHQLTGDARLLECCRRSAQWYVSAMRLDGGLFRDTGPDFKTPSFGHATSGIACAAILWADLIKNYGDTQWIEPLKRALSFCRSVQFTNASDSNLKGAILEKVLPPNGSDAPPWYLRELGTFFYVQAACQIVRDIPEVL
jgi:hypothetical protein